MVACLVHVPFLSTMRVYGKPCKPLLFYLMCVCVFIYRNDSLLMIIYKYEKIIRLDVLISMRDMSVRARSPATWSAFCYFDPLFSKNAGKNTAIFLNCQLLSDVTTQSQP